MYKHTKTSVEVNFYIEANEENRRSIESLIDILDMDDIPYEIPQELRLILHGKRVFLIPDKEKSRILVRILGGPTTIKEQENKVRKYLNTTLQKLKA